jgi:hypothetical protein
MDGIMTSWNGAHIDEVIRQWGYPHEERTVAGRKIYVWRRDVQAVMPSVTTGTATVIGSGVYYSGVTTGGVSSWGCNRILEVDPKNRVISWQWEGNNCPFAEMGPYSNWRRKN